MQAWTDKGSDAGELRLLGTGSSVGNNATKSRDRAAQRGGQLLLKVMREKGRRTDKRSASGAPGCRPQEFDALVERHASGRAEPPLVEAGDSESDEPMAFLDAALGAGAALVFLRWRLGNQRALLRSCADPDVHLHRRKAVRDPEFSGVRTHALAWSAIEG